MNKPREESGAGNARSAGDQHLTVANVTVAYMAVAHVAAAIVNIASMTGAPVTFALGTIAYLIVGNVTLAYLTVTYSTDTDNNFANVASTYVVVANVTDINLVTIAKIKKRPSDLIRKAQEAVECAHCIDAKVVDREVVRGRSSMEWWTLCTVQREKECRLC